MPRCRGVRTEGGKQSKCLYPEQKLSRICLSRVTLSFLESGPTPSGWVRISLTKLEPILEVALAAVKRAPTQIALCASQRCSAAKWAGFLIGVLFSDASKTRIHERIVLAKSACSEIFLDRPVSYPYDINRTFILESAF